MNPSMVTIYVMLILWSGGGELEQTYMIYESKAACEDGIAAQAAMTELKIKKATCTPQRVKRGVPIQITEGLTFTPY
jgi:hypothetical protein